MPCCAVKCMRGYAEPYHVMLPPKSHATALQGMHRQNMPGYAMQCTAMPCYELLGKNKQDDLLGSARHCYAMQCNDMLNHTVMCTDT
eukprot:93752-Pyramimonas_sp.AAC.1